MAPGTDRTWSPLGAGQTCGNRTLSLAFARIGVSGVPQRLDSRVRARAVPRDLSGGAWAIREKSSAMPRSERISQVLAHIITPAPISLNCPAASYTSTCMSGYLDSATASVRPPIPPPLRAKSRDVASAPWVDQSRTKLRHGTLAAYLMMPGCAAMYVGGDDHCPGDLHLILILRGRHGRP